ncbi:right-handed parallel beta-helix repeat-containing protein [Streptomyces aurantiacus]|uniref:Putative Plasmin and fibronectin-binding protein A n=1 Tax=Streptomyces aurantiacus JA 4570 TaxID=1286094 RepID=S3ZPN6_9ACTN|nr:right-handed parallel beta-helix repeat-containing protein [Streptomyces aurantiacus]EPH40330.1 putative Plasmin and fibronectin-binding protein A [Streptomyces aurantiacus JA 4570]
MQVTAGRLQYMLERLSESITVTSYGAVGDGTTDDAPAIQAALNAVEKLGGGWVIVPPGTYLLATLPLRGNGYTRLTLLPGARFVRGAAETMFVNGDQGQGFGGYTGHGNIIIEGGVWDCQGAAPGLTAAAMCISIGHARDITIRDLEIRDVSGYHAIELNSTKRATVDNCRFLGYRDPGQRDFSEAVQIDLAKSSGVFGQFGPYDHTPCEDIVISRCYFGPSGTAGTTAWPRGVGSHSATITRWHRRITVDDCSFEDITQYGVSAYNWEDSTIANCHFHGCGSGVRLRTVILTDTEDTKLPDGTQTSASQDLRNVAVTGNTIRAGTGYDDAIVALGETSGLILNLTVAGNTIDGNARGQNGIRLQRVSRATIGTNVITNVSGTGISTGDSGNLTVTGNQVWGVDSNGITFTRCDHSSAVANQIREPGQTGILVSDGNDIHLRDNYVRAPGRATNAKYYGMRLSSPASSVSVTGNKVRPYGSGAEAIHAFSAETGVTFVHRYGNDFRGSTWTGNAAMNDNSTTPNTSAADLT